ncbi:ras association domain-containing protein 1-like isoform X1 [Haliotis cracherodii]|uniref:ras association domain-containing protein 1-like isoform X1 n=2 Tax=Haliotis cracherodii TaxID=6455 RepID=UPI0039E89F9D
MAREYFEDIYIQEVEKVMAAANSVSGNCSESTSPDIFNAIKRRIVKVQANIGQNYKNVMQGIGLQLKKRNDSRSNDDDTHVLNLANSCFYQEHIEMESIDSEGRLGRGHDFVTCQLTNPTWCDKCGDFIWGLYKECLRCKNCQYTCHHNCVGSVTLDCTSVSQGSPNGEDTPKTGSAAETSLSQPKLRNSPKSVISKNNVLQSSQNEDISQRLAQLSTSSVPGVAQRVEHTVDNSVDVPADNTNKSHIGKLKKEKDETDSGYRSGTIPDEKLPKMPSQATLNRDELRRKIAEYNHLVPGSEFELTEEQGEAFQGFIKVTLNLIRPITMSLSMRPPSIYDLLTKEHIIEQNTQSVSFYMPRDTIKSIHVASETTTKEVVAALLKKFHILDHPRKFAMYEQEFSKNKLVRLKRVGDKDFPLQVFLNWDPRRFTNYRLVLQENETGEIVWEGFSRPELNNFLKVLDREEEECVSQLHYKYKVMKRIINQRLKELRKERKTSGTSPS